MFGAAATSTTPANPSPLGGPSTTPAASAPVPSLLRGKTLDEIVTTWQHELDDRTKDFADVAGEVREWDRVLRENGEQISQLYQSVLPLAPLQNSITTSLDYVEAQQKDLAAILDSYEAQIGDLVDQAGTGAGYRGGLSAAEKEREQAYALANSLSGALDSTGTSLAALIETLNALAPATAAKQQGQDEDPLGQIATILNAHLGSLKWIEGTTEGLQESVRELEGRVGQVSGRSLGGQGGHPGGTPARLGASARVGSPFRR